MRSLLSEWGRRPYDITLDLVLDPSGLTVAVEPAMQVDQCRRPFRAPTVLVAASYFRKTYVAKPFAAASLSSFPLGPS
jgi:hypothetical protein